VTLGNRVQLAQPILPADLAWRGGKKISSFGLEPPQLPAQFLA